MVKALCKVSRRRAIVLECNQHSKRKIWKAAMIDETLETLLSGLYILKAVDC